MYHNIMKAEGFEAKNAKNVGDRRHCPRKISLIAGNALVVNQQRRAA